MGSPSSEKGRDEAELLHTVTLTHGFEMSALEVTQGQFEAVMGYNPAATKRGFWRGREQEPCDSFQGKVSLLDAEYPAICVTWFEAIEFANRLSRAEGLHEAYEMDGEQVIWNQTANGYRLPTEAEWEYAARAGTSTPWGGLVKKAKSLCTVANVGDITSQSLFDGMDTDLEWAPCSDGVPALARGGLYAPNGWGLYDMVGNVWEWTWDTYGAYGDASMTDPFADQGTDRVNRGGGWGNKPASARIAKRVWNAPGDRYQRLGFRVVRSVP